MIIDEIKGLFNKYGSLPVLIPVALTLGGWKVNSIVAENAREQERQNQGISTEQKYREADEALIHFVLARQDTIEKSIAKLDNKIDNMKDRIDDTYAGVGNIKDILMRRTR